MTRYLLIASFVVCMIIAPLLKTALTFRGVPRVVAYAGGLALVGLGALLLHRGLHS